MEEHDQMPKLTLQYGDYLFGDETGETGETKEVRVRSLLVGQKHYKLKQWYSYNCYYLLINAVNVELLAQNINILQLFIHYIDKFSANQIKVENQF